MNEEPLVSVVLCTFNDEQFIANSIQSILGQSYKNFEFIIWNDGSTDNTEQIVNSFKDERIRYFFHENTGLGGALKLACEKARGKYIARMDGDDICVPNRLQKEVAYLEKHPNYVLVSGQMTYIDEDDRSYGMTFICGPDYIVRKRLPYGSTICHPGSMFRKSSYDECGGYEALRFMEDHLFFQRLLKAGKVHILTDVVIQYRVRKGSLIQSNINNPYSDLLASFRNKMLNDDVVSSDDVELYNQLYLYSKNHLSSNGHITKRKTKTAQERIYTFLKPIFGKDLSRKIVISTKNLIYYVKCTL